MYDFNGIEVVNHKTEKILEQFKARYINESYPERILFINHLNKVDKIIPIEKIRELNVPKDIDLFMYHERLKTVYITNFEKICLYVEQLEPWEDVDCLVFDKEFNWVLGITHNDTLLILGLK